MASRTLRTFVPTDAAALGAIRALLFGFVLVDMMRTDFIDLGRLPTTIMRPTGPMQLLPWAFYDVLITPRGMFALKCLLILSLLGATAGYSTKAATKLAALLFLFYQGLIRSFGHFNHDEMPLAYMLVVLAFTPCGDSFSVDSFLQRSKARQAGFAYGYPILLMQALLAWSYFSSALIKLRVGGLGYFNPDNLPSLAIMHSLDNLHDTHYKLAFWLPRARGLTTLLVVVVVVLWEFAFPFAIFSRIARLIILPFGLIFHVLTMFFMNLAFPYHVVAYGVFVDWPRVVGFIRAKTAPRLNAMRVKSISSSNIYSRFPLMQKSVTGFSHRWIEGRRGVNRR